ncbi:MAG: DUF5996 family protein, partial [Caulobacteraceae bacterium]
PPMPAHPDWPALPYPAWRETCETLQLMTQIVGKVRLSLTPWLNHSWHVPLYVSARGLTTSLIPHGGQGLDIEFDFIDQALWLRASDGGMQAIPLKPTSIADFYAQVLAALDALDMPATIHAAPNELPVATPFAEDVAPRAYDGEAAQRFWRALVQVSRVLGEFRTGFLGKSSPVHFFWGSFDLAVTRFSGRPAPPHPGGVPHLPDAVAREAYSHEVSSAGFWPGGGAIDYPAFYAYAYPEPPGFRDAPVAPEAAGFNAALGEFILPYDAVREAADPDQALLAFLRSTYTAAADNGSWDRKALECQLGRPGTPRAV